MSKDTGGPAFPVSYDHDTFQPSRVDEAKRLMSGMNLRDYFAAKFAAAQATATSADSSFINPGYVDPRDGRSVAQKIAETSYVLADAMLAARVKP